MALSEMEEKWLTEIVINTANVTAEKVAERFIAAHLLTCPYGKQLTKWMCVAIGVGIGIGIGGSEVIKMLLTAVGT